MSSSCFDFVYLNMIKGRRVTRLMCTSLALTKPWRDNTINYVWTSDGRAPGIVCLCVCDVCNTFVLRMVSAFKLECCSLHTLFARMLFLTHRSPTPGDMCWGYDLANANSVGLDFEAHVNR